MVQNKLRILLVGILGFGSLCLPGCGPGKLDPAKEAVHSASAIGEYPHSVRPNAESKP